MKLIDTRCRPSMRLPFARCWGERVVCAPVPCMGLGGLAGALGKAV